VTEKFIDKIDGVKKRGDELYAFFAREDSTKDMNEYNELSKEFSYLSPILKVIREYESCLDNKGSAEAFLSEARELGGDYYEMAKEELEALGEKEKSLLSELEMLLIPPDPRDEKNAIIEIRSGTGGKEAELFVYDLYRMYTMYAQRCGFETETVYGTLTELGGFKEVIFTVSGRGAFGRGGRALRHALAHTRTRGLHRGLRRQHCYRHTVPLNRAWLYRNGRAHYGILRKNGFGRCNIPEQARSRAHGRSG